ncbi:MAG: efflux RND transporter periplasmic adaptor subunit [Gemmatimonadaceae bacterium]|nr:efflux RND transporter periplasmic adaptor subunit [Gemmatimonadaceae bacterium]
MTTTRSVPSRVRSSARLAFLAAVVAASAACGGAATSDTAASPVTLTAADVMPAATADIGPSVVVSGALDPADIVRVRAQVAGTLRDMKVDRGAKVSRGQMLARIEAQGVTTGAEGAKANVASAEAAQAVALQRLDGAKKLFEAGAMSVIDLKTAQAGFDAAVAQLAAARAGLASASEAAGRTTIRSPIDGWVSDRMAEEGESVKSDDPVFTVVDPRTLELKGQVGAVDAARVRVGQVVTFTVDAMPGQEFKGTVARVDPMASAATRQVGVFARLANGSGKVVAGQFAQGRIRTGAVTKMVVVPINAVRTGEKDPFVLVVEGDVVRRRNVAVGARDDDAGTIVIASGLKAGERVVVTAGIEMADGTKVSTAKEK